MSWAGDTPHPCSTGGSHVGVLTLLLTMPLTGLPASIICGLVRSPGLRASLSVASHCHPLVLRLPVAHQSVKELPVPTTGEMGDSCFSNIRHSMGARPCVYLQKVSLYVITFVLIFAGQAVPSCPQAPLLTYSRARPPGGTMVTVVIMGIVPVALHLLRRRRGALSMNPGWGGTSAPSSDQGLELAEGGEEVLGGTG